MKKQMFRVLMLLVIMSSWKNQLKMKWRKRNDNSHRPWFRGPHHPKTLNRPWSPSPRRTGRGNNKRYACKVWYDYSVLHIFMFACMFPTYILAMFALKLYVRMHLFLSSRKTRSTKRSNKP